MFEKRKGGPSGWNEMNKEIVSDAESENLCSGSEGDTISSTTESVALVCSRYMPRSLNKMLVAWSERANTTPLLVLRSYTTVGARVDRPVPLSRGAEL